MKIDPLGPPKVPARSVALVEPGLRCVVVHTPDGSTRAEGAAVRGLFESLGERRVLVYCNSHLTRLRFTTDARAWRATVWQGRAVAMELEGTKFRAISLRGALTGASEPMEALGLFLDWLAGHDVMPSSVGTMATNLWRSTLTAPLQVYSAPEESGPAFYGGRQWAGEPRRYHHMQAVDIRCAYPHAMWALGPYARRLREVSPSTEITDEPGIAFGTMNLPPDAPFPLLPSRLTEVAPDALWWPRWGPVEGAWPWRGIRAAVSLGATFRPTRVLAPMGLCHPFAVWEAVVREARALPGDAAGLGKVVTNALWGGFALEGSRSSWRWGTVSGTRNAKCEGSEDARKLPQAGLRHWAAETTVRVRVRLLTEGLYRIGAGGAFPPPVHIDTDGFIVRASAPVPLPAGDELGQWRRTKEIVTLDVKAPQVYRWTCRRCGFDHGRWHYVCSGLPADAAEASFHERADGLEVGLRMPDGQVVTLSQTAAARRRSARVIAAQRSAVEPPAMFVES